MKDKLNDRNEDLRSSIKKAEDLIENNKGEMKEEGTQQLQKLRSSTTDLKVRLDA
ncbi:hypothetical protein ACJMK2_013613, partial [Sinanodonta woodiana]